MTEAVQKSPFVDVKQLAAYLGMSAEYVYRHSIPDATRDFIPHFKMGRKKKFRLDQS